jgi:hypothetical protein
VFPEFAEKSLAAARQPRMICETDRLRPSGNHEFVAGVKALLGRSGGSARVTAGRLSADPVYEADGLAAEEPRHRVQDESAPAQHPAPPRQHSTSTPSHRIPGSGRPASRQRPADWESAAKFNPLFTHGVRITAATDLDDELHDWLATAYALAG